MTIRAFLLLRVSFGSWLTAWVVKMSYMLDGGFSRTNKQQAKGQPHPGLK